MRANGMIFAASLLTLIPLVGCAQSRSAKGTFIGSPGVAVLRGLDGTPVEAATLRIEQGPPMSSPHIKPPVPTEGLEVILVDARQRIVEPSALPAGQRVSVVGRLPVYLVFKQDGSRLTTEDGKNVGGALQVKESRPAPQAD